MADEDSPLVVRSMTRTMPSPKELRRCLLAMVVFTACGCEDIDWDWEMQEWRQPRRPIRPVRPRASKDFNPNRPRVRTGRPPYRPSIESQDRPSETEKPRPRPEAAPSPAAEAPMSEQRSYYQLYVIGEEGSLKTPPNSKKLRLTKATSRAASDLLHRIYPSVGPSGGENQRFLVYQHEPMWLAATDLVPLLDCSEVAEPPPADPADPQAAFQLAVGMVYRLSRPGQSTDFEKYERCLRLLNAVIRSERSSGQLRWASAVLAGRIATETLSDFARATRFFQTAKGSALPGSVEEMISVYCLADVHVHQGQKKQAVELAQRLAKQFPAHRNSALYERAVAMTREE